MLVQYIGPIVIACVIYYDVSLVKYLLLLPIIYITFCLFDYYLGKFIRKNSGHRFKIAETDSEQTNSETNDTEDETPNEKENTHSEIEENDIFSKKEISPNDSSDEIVIEKVSEIRFSSSSEDNIENGPVFFTYLYKSIYHYNFRHLAEYVTRDDYEYIPTFLENGKQLKTIDRTVYAIIYKLSSYGIYEKNHTIEYFFDMIKENDMNLQTITAMMDTNRFERIKKEYVDFICNRRNLYTMNLYTTSDKVTFKNNRYYIDECDD